MGILELHSIKMKVSPGQRRKWQRLKSSKSKLEKEIIIKFLVLSEVQQRKKFRKHIRTLHFSGIQTSSRMRRRKRQPRKSSWTLPRQRKSSPMPKCEPSMTRVRTPWILRGVREIILSDKEDSISLVVIHLVAVPSSSSFISTETDLMAFTQTLFTFISCCHPYFY